MDCPLSLYIKPEKTAKLTTFSQQGPSHFIRNIKVTNYSYLSVAETENNNTEVRSFHFFVMPSIHFQAAMFAPMVHGRYHCTSLWGNTCSFERKMRPCSLFNKSQRKICDSTARKTFPLTREDSLNVYLNCFR